MVSVSASAYAAIAREAERRGVHAAVVVAAALAGEWPADAVERTRAASVRALSERGIAGGSVRLVLRDLDVPSTLLSRVDALVSGTRLHRRVTLERAINAALDAEGART